MKLFSKKKKRRPNISKLYYPESPEIVEVQRLFKTLYSKGRTGAEIKSLVITSAMPQEGKSILIGCLALVAAHANRRTIVIDADLRRPAQHHQFSSPRNPGLSDYLLVEEVGLDQIAHNAKLEKLKNVENSDLILKNLRIIPCGARNSSPGGLLHSNPLKIKDLLNQCRANAEVVLVDVPPVLPVNDAELIGSLVDGVALIVKSGKTNREIVDRALALLKKANCNLLGLVLNNITGALPYHYETSYYDYGYDRPGPVWAE